MTRLVRKSLGTLIRETLESLGQPVVCDVREDGRLMYQVYDQWLTPGDVAKMFGIEWGS